YNPGCYGEYDVLGFNSVNGKLFTGGIKNALDAGLGVNVWTENDPERMKQLIKEGVTGIITDYPNRLKKVLDEPKKALPWLRRAVERSRDCRRVRSGIVRRGAIIWPCDLVVFNGALAMISSAPPSPSSPTLVVFFDQPELGAVSQVGGKGSNLIALRAAGF